MHLTTALAVAAAAAVLTGALLVGDSMRGSLRQVALGRLGRVDYALAGGRYFREALATELADTAEFASRYDRACPIVLGQGSIRHAGSAARVNQVNVLGVDHRFGQLAAAGDSVDVFPDAGRIIVLNEPLAHELQAKVGDEVLVSLQAQARVPIETLLGRREETGRTLRLAVRAIIPADGLGGFSLKPAQYHPFNAYVPLTTLQRALDERGRANAILVAGRPDAAMLAESDSGHLQQLVDRSIQLSDLGLTLRHDDKYGCVVLESDRLLLEPEIETAAVEAAKTVGAPATRVLTYLANTIDVERSDLAGSQSRPSPATAVAEEIAIPYSTVTAIDCEPNAGIGVMTLTDGRSVTSLVEHDILLNEWAADDLNAGPGDTIRLSYYVLGPFGQLRTASAAFTLRGIVRVQGIAADPGLAPQYKGLTDAKDLAAWDPPFPIDLSRIREKDEVYWDNYGPTPKAFVSLRAGQALWTQEQGRFGRLTSIRIGPAQGRDIAATAAAFDRELLHRVSGERMGLTVEPVRAHALAAAEGSTDFAALFMGFSLFLIASAAMLVAMMFRLGVQRRSSEVGILLATGFSPRTVARLLLAEGVLLAGVGSAIGLIGAIGYASLMLTGLASWWSDAVGAVSMGSAAGSVGGVGVPLLGLHVRPASLLIGAGGSVVVGLLSIAWAVRGLSRASPRSLLAGAISSGTSIGDVRRQRVYTMLAVGSFVIVLILIGLSLGTGVLPETPAFFASGTAMLVACLSGLAAWMGWAGRGFIVRAGWAAIVRLGIRSAGRHPRRSLLTVGLIACATFIIVAVGANRRDAGGGVHAKQSGTGGFTLMAESTAAILYDLNTATGREALGMTPSPADMLADTVILPFCLHDGDEASCLNLYQAHSPRILGANDAMIDRGGFQFQSTLAETDEEKRNPWLLLNRSFPDGAVPAIGDYSTVVWMLHLGLGQDLVTADERGGQIRLRIIGLLSGSLLQGELVIAESRFVELLPSVAGYRFFLIDAPPAACQALAQVLENDLSDFGFDVTPAADRLNQYLAVENTYLSTFQTLGGLGLILGTFGLAAVLLRSVLERRGEFALLRALGYRRSTLSCMVMVENTALLLSGLAAGALSAVLAVAPHTWSSASAVPWCSVMLILGIVLLAGTLAGAVALIPTLRSPLLPALRTE